MKEWLQSKGNVFVIQYSLWMMHLKSIIGLTYPEKAIKKDLWEIIKKSMTPPVYAIDKIAKEHGNV